MRDLSTITFLQGFSAFGILQDGHAVSFNVFLRTIDIANLTSMLTEGIPYLIFVPTDEAFEALPKDHLAELMLDPKSLADLLRCHIVKGSFPRGSLFSTTYNNVSCNLTNIVGTVLRVRTIDSLTFVNGINVGTLKNHLLPKGTRVWPITKLLQPSANFSQTGLD